MGVRGTSCGSFFLLGSSPGGEATGTLSVSWPVGGVWNDEGAACHTNDRSQQINGHIYGVKELAVLIDCQWNVKMEAVEMTRVAVVKKVRQLECSQQF